MMTSNLIFSFGFFIFLYKFVPLYLTSLLGNELSRPARTNRLQHGGRRIRMAIFLGFLYMISRWKDIRRVFEYHGAEHKVVFNFESGKPVNEATRRHSRLSIRVADQLSAGGDDRFHRG